MEQTHPTQTTPTPTIQKQLLTVQEVKQLTGFSVTSIYQYVKDGIFPKPKKCGRSTRWRLSDVMEYVNN